MAQSEIDALWPRELDGFRDFVDAFVPEAQQLPAHLRLWVIVRAQLGSASDALSEASTSPGRSAAQESSSHNASPSPIRAAAPAELSYPGRPDHIVTGSSIRAQVIHAGKSSAAASNPLEESVAKFASLGAARAALTRAKEQIGLKIDACEIAPDDGGDCLSVLSALIADLSDLPPVAQTTEDRRQKAEAQSRSDQPQPAGESLTNAPTTEAIIRAAFVAGFQCCRGYSPRRPHEPD